MTTKKPSQLDEGTLRKPSQTRLRPMSPELAERVLEILSKLSITKVKTLKKSPNKKKEK